MVLSVEDVKEVTGGRGGPGTGKVTGVSTDTRTIKEGEAFFALKGPNFDGADFVSAAADKGATVAVVSAGSAGDTGKASDKITVIEVDDTLRALGDLARYVRKGSGAKVLAITGSTGKTTTKEMVAAILGESKRVLKTEGNRNNMIGLPMTLMGLIGDYDVAVVELGINMSGEMERLSDIASPDVALITNIGRGHTEGLGDLEGVAAEKVKIFASLDFGDSGGSGNSGDSGDAGGTAVVNMDDPLVVEAAEALPDGIEKITFGSGEGVSGEGVSSDEGSGLDVRITEVVLDKEAAMVDAFYEVRGEEVNAAFASPLLTNAANGAAAIAGALALGATIDDIRGALASVSALPGRMEVIRCASCTVIDDSYNANPESMEAALTTLAAMGRPKVAVLGDMLELGDLAWQAHRSAGKQAAEAGVRKLVAIGERAGEIAQGAISAGMKHVDVLTFSTAEGAVEAVENFTSDGDTVLVKGSRGVGLDKVVQKLKTRG